MLGMLGGFATPPLYFNKANVFSNFRKKKHQKAAKSKR
jgi:hypothetical protein